MDQKSCINCNSKQISKSTPRYHKLFKSNWSWRIDISAKIYVKTHCGCHWLHKGKTNTRSRPFSKTKQQWNIFVCKKNYISANSYISGLALTGFPTTRPCLQQVNLTWHDAIQKPSNGSAVNYKKQMTSELGPAIRSRDTGQRISCFDRCQLTITWVSDIKRDATTEDACLCQQIS